MSEIEILARALVDLRDRTIQKTRIQFSNRISAIERDKDDSEYASYIRRWMERFNEIEKDLDKSIEDLADDMPIVERMIRVRGVGKILAVKIAAMIDIQRADTISALWRYAGYAVVDGHREKPVKGEPLHYNTRLKTTCYLVGTSFLRSNSPYRKIYDEARGYYEENRKEWTKAHQHMAAMRKMTKLWLSHLWLICVRLKVCRCESHTSRLNRITASSRRKRWAGNRLREVTRNLSASRFF